MERSDDSAKKVALLLTAILSLSVIGLGQRDLLHLRPSGPTRTSQTANDAQQLSVSVPTNPGFGLFSVPGSTSTGAFGVNNLGQIVGFFVSGGIESGFLFDVTANTFTTITYPGSISTWAQGINDEGTIVGYYVDAADSAHGFVEQGGIYTTLDYPGSSYTIVNGINDRGDMVGVFEHGGSLPGHGFLYTEGSFIKLDPPGSANTNLTGINYSREISGSYSPSSCGCVYGVVYDDGTFTNVNYPNVVSTGIYGINDHGDLAGSHAQAGQYPQPFIYRSRQQVFFSFGFGSDTATAYGINDAGEVVGTTASNSVAYGFYRLPNTKP